jgi:hypothetical protein
VQELSALVEVMMKKHRREAAAYPRAAAACFRLGLLPLARRLMQRALGALDKKQRKLTSYLTL